MTPLRTVSHYFGAFLVRKANPAIAIPAMTIPINATEGIESGRPRAAKLVGPPGETHGDLTSKVRSEEAWAPFICAVAKSAYVPMEALWGIR